MGRKESNKWATTRRRLIDYKRKNKNKLCCGWDDDLVEKTLSMNESWPGCVLPAV